MQSQPDYAMISLIHFAITAGICVLGVLFFWKLRHRRKPVLAWTLWVLAFGYTGAQLWQRIALAYIAPGLMTVALGAISVMILALYVAAVFYTPWPELPLDDDFDEDDDGKPFKVPDEV